MILLTGATGTVGAELLRRLSGRQDAVRCLVRDPRQLGPERVRVQLALGDLADPSSFRNALRGVDTVIHLAASIRDQPDGSIEELNALATLRLVRAAERAGVKRFVFFAAIGASPQSPTRFMRSKALARRAVESSSLETTVFAPSIIYSPGDHWLKLLGRLSLLPAVPIAGGGRTRYEPIWAGDVADCVIAALDRPGSERRRSFELAGPEALTYDELVGLTLAVQGRRRKLLHVPWGLVRTSLRAVERLPGRASFATWEEAKLMGEPMVSAAGPAGAESLGVEPRRMRSVLSAA